LLGENCGTQGRIGEVGLASGAASSSHACEFITPH